MSLVCPECESASFKIVGSVECGPDRGADENTIQRAFCKECAAVFLCVYKSTRSFRSDRDDRVTHLAFATDQGLWNSSADIFEKPTSRVSSEAKIAAAMCVLRMAQETGGTGQPIAYAPAPPSQMSTQTESNAAGTVFQTLRNWCRKKS